MLIVKFISKWFILFFLSSWLLFSFSLFFNDLISLVLIFFFKIKDLFFEIFEVIIIFYIINEVFVLIYIYIDKNEVILKILILNNMDSFEYGRKFWF